MSKQQAKPNSTVFTKEMFYPVALSTPSPTTAYFTARWECCAFILFSTERERRCFIFKPAAYWARTVTVNYEIGNKNKT